MTPHKTYLLRRNETIFTYYRSHPELSSKDIAKHFSLDWKTILKIISMQLTKYTPKEVIEKRDKKVFCFYLNNLHLNLQQIGDCMGLHKTTVSKIISQQLKKHFTEPKHTFLYIEPGN